MLKLFFCILMYVAIANCDEVAQVFQEAEIVPDVISKAPSKLVTIEYENDVKVNNGNILTPTQVKNLPIKVDYEYEENTFYTLIMIDPDAPSRTEPRSREFNHWLVVNIPGKNIKLGTSLTEYLGAGPPKGTGLHRYIFLVYKQSGKLEFDEPLITNKSGEGRPQFSADKFAKKYKLGNPIAGNFYEAEYDDYVPILHKQLSP